MCILLNDAYELLSDPKSRESYDYDLELAKMDDGYTGKPLSKWSKRHLKEGETRAVYVDESACIGCKQCVWAASATFRMEDDYGRSRVFAQWLNSEDDIQCAIDSCPVDCIHWVHKDELPALEFVTQRMVKQSVGIMMGTGEGGGQRGTDPFAEAKAFLKQRERFVRGLAHAPLRVVEARRDSRRVVREHGLLHVITDVVDHIVEPDIHTLLLSGLPGAAGSRDVESDDDRTRRFSQCDVRIVHPTNRGVLDRDGDHI